MRVCARLRNWIRRESIADQVHADWTARCGATLDVLLSPLGFDPNVGGRPSEAGRFAVLYEIDGNEFRRRYPYALSPQDVDEAAYDLWFEFDCKDGEARVNLTGTSYSTVQQGRPDPTWKTDLESYLQLCSDHLAVQLDLWSRAE